ncbi:similar to Saccharomyces cerevisiae YEL001C IRC22 Putative protein of unknown function [Maudiozyma saulgeensis]|uniref:Increased recombination centers protein 22 n=1 Tax=Maudiozyma saulgeensis TaxID=1789683 RepID=A0A1X7R2T4_9SACH|nr:similar to Saccharomyces cerevisiae YEL001C IRC22 Putative protein of unknown function [Kazachstania saulgeensis]
MKFSKLTLLALLSATTVFGQQIEDNQDVPTDEEAIVIDNSANVENERPKVNFTITYTILERPPYDISEFLEFETEDVATLNYTITNNENFNYTLNSVGGSIMRFENGFNAANITSGKFNPVIRLDVNQTVSVQQRVTFLDMKDDDYYIQPKVYVQELEENAQELELAAPLTLMTIMKPPMSLFDPQFLSVQILIIGVIMAVSYFFLNFTLNGKKKKTNNANKNTVSNKTVDTSSFLPDQYKK